MLLRELIDELYNLISNPVERAYNLINNPIKKAVKNTGEKIREAYKEYPAISKAITNIIRKTAEKTKNLESIKILGQAYLIPEVKDAIKSYFTPESYLEYILDRFNESYKEIYEKVKKEIKENKNSDIERSLRAVHGCLLSLYGCLLSLGEMAIKGCKWREYLVKRMLQVIGRTALETKDPEVIKLMAETYLEPKFKEVLWMSLKMQGYEKRVITKLMVKVAPAYLESKDKFKKVLEEVEESVERYDPEEIITEIGKVAKSKNREKISKTITNIHNKLWFILMLYSRAGTPPIY